MAAEALAIEVMYEWAPTEEVVSVACISHFNGLWSVPGIPVSEHGRYAVGHTLRERKPNSLSRHMRRLPTLKHPRSLVHIVGSQPLTNKHARQV